MRSRLVLVTSMVAALVTGLCVEGLFSIASWRRPHRSVVYNAYASLRGRHANVAAQPSGLPSASRAEIEALIPDMVAAGVGMGNVPYNQLVTERAAINAIGADGCLAPKPGVDKITTFIRSGDFERFDPPSVFYDRGASLPEEVRSFIARYAVRKVRFTSNELGERTTLPTVVVPRKVLVAGDSVAIGSMIDDSETITSQLQRGRSDIQFINLGVNGAAAADIVCRLTKAALRYRGQIASVIYVYCENDFDAGRPYGVPEEVVAWLRAFANENEIPRVTVIFAPFIYNILPSVTRFPGSRGEVHQTYQEESGRLKAAATAADFGFLDIGDIARAEATRLGTDFAAFALFVDHNHLSAYGVSLVVDALATSGGPLGLGQPGATKP